jgi:hypothetical protein
MIVRFLLLLGLAVLAACQSSSKPPPLTVGMTASQAVMAAADAAPNGVSGTFALIVRRADMVGPRLFLNSQGDYRDQRNLSIAIQPGALAGLRQKLGGDPQAILKGKDIRVTGVARRTRIDFTEDGKPTGKYYYQTHVAVTDPAQVAIID